MKGGRGAPLALCLLVAALLASLPRASAQSTLVRFGAVADYGTASQPEQDVANLINSWNPDFVISMGDNNYPSGKASTIDANIGQYYHQYISPYLGAYGTGSATNRFWPCLGNHDWGNTYPNPTGDQPYLSYFTLPGNERYYDFVRGPVHFFVVDSDQNEPDGNTSTSKQAAWLQSALAAATEPWKLVYFHHPPYSSGTIGSVTNMRWPFQQWGATAVLCAHAHDYERINKNGFRYFVCGVGGNTLEPFAQYLTSGSEVRYCADYGAMLITADSGGIDFQFINRQGVQIDDFVIGTRPGTPPPAPPSAPAGLTATAASSSQINLKWSDVANETGFAIEEAVGSGSFSQVTAVAGGTTTYAATGLSALTQYSFRIRAFNAAGNSPYSNVATATTTGPPAAPTGLTAKTASSSQVNLTWSDVAGETGFAIEEAVGSGSFSQVTTVAAGTTSFAATGLSALTQYSFRVRAFNSAGNSPYSNVATATTSGPPLTPAGLTATAVSSSQVNLAWGDVANETGFAVEEAAGSGSYSQITTVAGGTTSLAVGGLSASTQYSFRVRAFNSAGNSPYSNVATVTTSAAPATITLTPVADAYVRDGSYVKTNFGSDPVLYSRTTSEKGYNRNAYLKFSLAGLSSVGTATLQVFGAPSGGSASSVSACSVSDTTWTENGIIWNGAPALGGTLSRVNTSGSANVWYSLDVTSYIRSAVAAGQTLVTIGLRNDGKEAAYNAFNSREAGSNAPQLVIKSGS